MQRISSEGLALSKDSNGFNFIFKDSQRNKILLPFIIW